MTLKEAHEIQRKELIALRRENASLKEGTYTDAEKLEHEKSSVISVEDCRLRQQRLSMSP